MPRSGTAGLCGGFIPSFFFFFFFYISILSSIVAISVYIPTSSTRGFLFSTLSVELAICGFFDDGPSDWCEVISHCIFDLHFSNNERC